MNSSHLFWINVLFFISMVIFTILINSILLSFSKNLGIRDKENTVIRWNPVSKPALGGITFFIVFLITLAIFSFLFESSFNFHNKSILALVLVCTIAFTMGLADDAYNTKPLLKLLAQIFCGIVMYLCGTYIQTTPYEWLNITLTILWIVGIMNSINMLDNMDAITGSVSAGIITMYILCIVATDTPESFDFLVLTGVLASLIGFLFHNWFPSKLFMGDSGSQFLGMFLAFYGIKYFWNGTDYFGEVIQAKQLTLVLIGFLLPFCDTGIVVINRLMKKKSPFIGGKDHTTHHLSFLGLSDAKVATIFIALNFISLFSVLAIMRIIEGWSHLLTIVFWAYFFIVFCILFWITHLKKRKHEV